MVGLRMKKFGFVFLVVVVVMGALGYYKRSSMEPLSPLVFRREKELPLNKYSLEGLVERVDIVSPIEVGRVLGEDESYTAYVFYFQTEGGRVSGQLNVPKGTGPFPAVVAARGYVPPEGYTTGTGTRNATQYFAARGYITFAPDFLGYGESDEEDENNIKARLMRPATLLDLIASVREDARVDMERIYLWGHSNGGQIVLTVASVLGKRSSAGKDMAIGGATLWAPVSKPFPYSVLYYTDDSEDRGKELRRVIADFEREYDVFRFSIDNYLDWIAIPLVVHQGSADDAVPKEWSDELVRNLEEKGKEVEYYTYPGADHNMRPVWSTVVARDVGFFGRVARDR